MSECLDEVFTQEAGLICAKTLDVVRLYKENEKLKQELIAVKGNHEFSILDTIRLKNCINECLAIVAHVDPETYNNRQAVDMIKNEMLKALKDLDSN